MKKFGNNQRDRFMNEKEDEKKKNEEKRVFSHNENNISSRLKFNLSYFRPESPGYDFSNLTQEKLNELIVKIKEYSREPLIYWENQNAYEKYGKFPEKSDFFHPESVPTEISWGRFRIGRMERLVGFTIPQNSHGEKRSFGGKDYFLDYNTFYVVFLDLDHKFYITSSKK